LTWLKEGSDIEYPTEIVEKFNMKASAVTIAELKNDLDLIWDFRLKNKAESVTKTPHTKYVIATCETGQRADLTTRTSKLSLAI
jgi:hypothetical protein